MWFSTTFLNASSFTNHIVDWLTKRLPVKSAIFIYLDMDNYVLTHEIFGSVVERINKVHHVETPLTQCATYRRTCRCASGWDAELKVSDNFFCHVTVPLYYCCIVKHLAVRNRGIILYYERN